MTSIPHSRFVDAHADWVIERIDHLISGDRHPLVVPMTVTFDPGSIRADGVLREFERLYVRVCRLLMCNPERPSKRPLLPFTLAYRDDPRPVGRATARPSSPTTRRSPRTCTP